MRMIKSSFRFTKYNSSVLANYVIMFIFTLMSSATIKIVGVMSGTSLDGLDLVLCEFYTENNQTQFKVLANETINYEAVWKERLQNVFDATAEQYFMLHGLYGKFIGESITAFLTQHQETAHYIASHGHTIFHRPELGFTTQIGCGATIAATTNLSTICDFRSLDVALKGQGAPLVPIGDRDLFPNNESCLNLGGIANISFTKHNTTQAFDICIANMALNYLTEEVGKAFDDKGQMASKGKIDEALLKALLAIDTQQKSIGRELFEKQFLPLLQQSKETIADKLATCVEYTAIKIAACLNEAGINSVLITGGGAYNTFLIERLEHFYKGEINIPNNTIIQFKEAIIFAYLGYLRVKEETNTLQSVTKATKNSVGGCIYYMA